MPLSAQPVIPVTITVHLGAPSDQNAENVTVPFTDYIKNVASSEIYPTWPENSLRANIYAQITFALNRIYTEYYRSRGRNFDITNNTAYDQAFVYGRNIFENISGIVDEIFNSYVVRQGFVEPYFTQYCSGTTVTCGGLSQWGTVSLAEDGYTPYAILQYYYGQDIDIRRNVPVAAVNPSVPATPLSIGSTGNAVLNVQIRLNRISRNYPAIPKIYPTDGIYGAETAEAVTVFQRIFNLSQSGTVDTATWYRIIQIFTGVKRLNELNSEGLRLEEIGSQFPAVLRYGDTGVGVRVMQYYLSFVAAYLPQVPSVIVNGTFDDATRDAVYAFQNTYGLDVDGIVGELTWNRLYNVYRGLVDSIPDSILADSPKPFGGYLLKRGMKGEDVRVLQEYLSLIASVYPEIPAPSPDGDFGGRTYDAVIAFQRLFGFDQNGIVGPIVWNAIAEEAVDIRGGDFRSSGQYPGDRL